ncbi:Uncharacterized protein conserved in cyanobacteria [Gloeomargarita lithophora Alchichica-D10]|uniref:Uncharacterized protein conserved in cyanobacteria n=1 Tax=Gloeomargarita lithophora Alchichica-D10 TaxID=1188229 RepID=A0A1J0AFK1_9CYAN|nr:Uma2 family endonuclease [Gloeomargarita lithophora]APB34714.1 Uncharacterized protein conserved in cyanobacteria [Gloeomargarita lithophora Alchichica-D10]
MVLAVAPLNFEEFLAQYGQDNRYELIDGEVFDVEPTGAHEEVVALLTRKVCGAIEAANLPRLVFQRGILRPANTTMTAFRPDIMVVNRPALTDEPLWREQSIVTQGRSIPWVAEVVSRNWQNDYARKLEDYGVWGISEYWIVDYAGLGGVRHIGKPKQPTLSICTLVQGEYQIQQFRGSQAIYSPTFPAWQLTAAELWGAPG